MTFQRGAALLVALWALVFLAVLMGGVVAAVRLENKQSHDALSRSHALISAEAGLALAVERLLEPASHPLVPDGREYEMLLEGVKVAFSVRSERGKLDLNFADPQAFARLLLYLGANRNQALQLSEQLRSLRTAGRLVKVLEQVQAFNGMDSELYQKLEPHITLWTGLNQPDTAFATPDVRAALSLPNPVGVSNNPGSTVTVNIRGQMPDGFSAGLHVTLYLNPAGGGHATVPRASLAGMKKLSKTSAVMLRSGLGPLLFYWRASVFPTFIRWWGRQLIGCLPVQWQLWLVADNEMAAHWRNAALWDSSGRQIVPGAVNHSPDAPRVVLVLAAQDVLTRQIVLPPTAASELSAIMKYELDRYMPFTAEQVYIDYEPPVGRPDKSLQVNLVVVARRRLDSILQTLGDQGIKVASVAALNRDGHRLLVDLTPNNWQVAKADPRRRTGWILILASVALTLLAMHLWVVARENQLDAMREEVRALRSQAQAVQGLRESLNSARDEGQYVGVRKAQAPSMIGLLSELSQCIPPNTWLEQLSVNTVGDVALDGQSQQASALIAQMRKCTSLSNPGFTGVIQTDASTGQDRFSILAHLKPEGQQNAPEIKAP